MSFKNPDRLKKEKNKKKNIIKKYAQVAKASAKTIEAKKPKEKL